MANARGPTLVPCADAGALESAFAARLRALAGARRDPFSPITVVAPTARLLSRLQAVAARELGAAAGIAFLVHRGLAEAALERAERPPLRLISAAAFEAMAAAAARGAGGEIAAAVDRFETGAASLAATLRDLRDAGVPADARVPGLGALEAGVLAAHARLAEALSRRARAGETDAAGLFAAAAQAAPRAAARFGPILHAGVFDLVGVVRDLIDALAASTPVEVLALGARGDAGDRGSLFGARTSVLFDDEAPLPPSLPRGAVEWVHAPSTESEIAAAARRALRWHEEGVPLEEIAILARTLEPYAAHLQPTLEEHGLPFTSSAKSPLLGAPAARAVLDLLESAALSCPRATWMRVLRSPFLDRSALGIAASRVRPDRFDRLTRRLPLGDPREVVAACAREIEELPADASEARRAAAQRDLEDARSLAEATSRLLDAARAIEPARGWDACAGAMLALARGFLRADEADACAADLEAALRCVGELAELESIAEPPASLEAAVARARRALEDARVPVAAADRGGVRVLDLMQARGLAFRRVVLLGLHEGSMPRVGFEDPWLSDRARRALASATRRPVPLKGDAEAEERALLAHALGAARETLVVSWQRADEDGRRRSASPFLREIARAARGDSDAEAARAEARRIPGHPEEAARDAIARDGLLAPPLAVAAAGFAAADRVAAVRETAGALNRLAPAFADALDWLETTDRFQSRAGLERDDLRFDGHVAPIGAGDETFSISALERLAQCPLKHFFADRLGVEAPRRPEDEPVIDPRFLGSFAHRALETIYRDLPWGSDLETLLAAARARIPESVDRAFEPVARVGLERFPALARATRDAWREAIARFVEADLRALHAAGAASLETELDFRQRFSLGAHELEIRGRFDRVARLAAGGERIGDYKTTRARIEEHASVAKAIRGEHLQLVLYALARQRASGALPDAEILRVRPDPGAGARRRPWSERAALDHEEMRERETDVGATLTALGELLSAGFYPFTLDRDRCELCDFRRACRVRHAPTYARVESAAPFAAYHARAEWSPRARAGAADPGEERSA